jgi:hypothetical protein
MNILCSIQAVLPDEQEELAANNGNPQPESTKGRKDVSYSATRKEVSQGSSIEVTRMSSSDEDEDFDFEEAAHDGCSGRDVQLMSERGIAVAGAKIRSEHSKHGSEMAGLSAKASLQKRKLYSVSQCKVGGLKKRVKTQ